MTVRGELCLLALLSIYVNVLNSLSSMLEATYVAQVLL